ncbi:hypothetical protein F4782DRAFT_527098 [Xylaria castorea]|nr:hypothetical protein F4782DRAFT_527098 [Xylaria castorea]
MYCMPVLPQFEHRDTGSFNVALGDPEVGTELGERRRQHWLVDEKDGISGLTDHTDDILEPRRASLAYRNKLSLPFPTQQGTQGQLRPCERRWSMEYVYDMTVIQYDAAKW